MRKTVAAIIVSFACSRLLCAQTSTALDSAVPLPTVNGLTYADAERFWSDLPTPYVYGPLGCASDGSVFIYSVLDANLKPVRNRSRSAPVSFIQEPTPPMVTENTPMQLEVIEPTGHLWTFDVTHIGDLRSMVPARSYDVGENSVDFLMSAIPGKIGVDTQGKRGNFVARFNREGQYLGATPLQLPGLNPLKLATFPNGDLLIFAADEANATPRLLLYSQQTHAVMRYQPDAAFADRNDAMLPSFPRNAQPAGEQLAKAQLDAAVLNTQMVHRKDAILVLQMNAGSPLFEAFANGSIRSIDLPKVEGFTADSLIPSDELLYVRYRKVGTISGKGEDALILEVNPASGEEMRRIPPGNFGVWSVACVRNRTVRAVRWGSQHNIQFLSAALR
jgi:hypothetical protein